MDFGFKHLSDFGQLLVSGGFNLFLSVDFGFKVVLSSFKAWTLVLS